MSYNSEDTYRNKDWLYNAFCVEKKTPTQIGILVGVNRHTINNWLKRFNICEAYFNNEVYEKLICPTCAKEFYKSKSVIKEKQKLSKNRNFYCSKECYLKAKNSSYNPTNPNSFFNKTCPTCKKTFHSKPSKDSKYCSRGCYAKAVDQKVTVKCDYCKKEVRLAPSTLYWKEKRNENHVFCSPKCSALFHRGENSHHYIKDRSKLKDRNKSARWAADMIEWRKLVYERDDYTCQMCGCKNGEGKRIVLNAHHIIRFIDNESLRTAVCNGITLCEPCHKKTYGHEQDFEEQFQDIVKQKEVVNAAV